MVRPISIIWGAEDLKYRVQLTYVGLIALQEWPSEQELSEDAPSAPYVGRRGVFRRSKQQLGRLIPQCDRLRRQPRFGRAIHTRESEIG